MKFKNTCSPQSKGSVTKKFISSSLAMGLLFNTTLPSLASTLSEDGRYETLEDNNITIDNVLEEDTVDVEIEGNTMVNVANQKDAIPITKGYTVEGTNHIPLQGDYDGKAMPVIEGNTLVNHLGYMHYASNTYIDNGDSYTLKLEAGNGQPQILYNLNAIKTNTIYTVIFNADIVEGIPHICFMDSSNTVNASNELIATTSGRYALTLTTNDNESKFLRIIPRNGLNSNFTIYKDIMIFEGDLTGNPPTEYFEGLKSSFEDQLVTQDMVDCGQEKPENLGKYKVEYKVTGKNKFNENFAKVYDNWEKLSYKVFPIHLKPNTQYTFKRSNDENYSFTWLSWVKQSHSASNNNMVYWIANAAYPNRNSTNFTFKTNSTGIIYLNIQIDDGLERHFNAWGNIQIEEGTTATEYEPYKESIKIFYLNSPLLEGDTIEDVNGKATHVKRYDKVVLNGSEIYSHVSTPPTNYFYIEIPKIKENYPTIICDKLKVWENKIGSNNNHNTGISTTAGKILRLRLEDKEMPIEEFKQWLSENPTTIVYELAEPVYETILEESILIDSYKNGHLDLNSNTPVNKIDFMPTSTELNYLYPSKEYTVQFESDNIGKIDSVSLGNEEVYNNYSVRKGVNRFNITTPSEISSTELIIDGIGFNLSSLVVTKVMDENFDYFEGIQSSFENNLVTQEMVNIGQEKTENLGKYKVEVKSTGKNKFDVLSYAKIIESLGVGDYTNNVLTIRKSDSFVDKDIPNIVYQPNTPYTISFDFENMARPDNPCNEIILRVYYTDGTRKDITPWSFTGLSKGHVIAQTDATKTISHIRFSYILPTGETKFKNIQIEEGIESTPYEPYKESVNKFYLKSPLLKGDTIDIVNGKVYHVKKYGQTTYNGTEYWGTYPTYTNDNIYSVARPRPTGCSSFSKVICSRFKNTYISGINEAVSVGLNNIEISISSSELMSNSITGFKQWLSENPVTVVYELENPIYEPIKADLSVQLFEGTTHITNNSNIPANMKITVDRTMNRAVEAIELAENNPTSENLANARYWTNLLRESIKKDELQSEITDINGPVDITLERKDSTANLDVYIKSENMLSMSLDTNSVSFDNYSGVSAMEIKDAVGITISSSLPYNLNAYMPTTITNSDGLKTIPIDVLNIKEGGEDSYQTFESTTDKVVLKGDCAKGNGINHSIDLKLDSNNAHQADIYKTVIKFEAEQQ